MHFMQYLSLTALAHGVVHAVPVAAEVPSYGPGTPDGLPPLPANITSGIHHFEFGSDGTMKTNKVAELDDSSRKRDDGDLEKRVSTWTGCEKYSFTNSQRLDVENAWAGLLNWAGASGTGISPWIDGHYFAMTDSGVYAYLCEWGRGNQVKTSQINEAHGVLGPHCANGPGIFQWNEWRKGVGVAATGQKWCNNQSPP